MQPALPPPAQAHAQAHAQAQELWAQELCELPRETDEPPPRELEELLPEEPAPREPEEPPCDDLGMEEWYVTTGA